MERMSKIFTYFLSCALMMGGSLTFKDTSAFSVAKAEATPNASYVSIFSDDYNNTQHATGYNRILITYSGTAHGNPGPIVESALSAYDEYVLIDNKPISTYAGGSTQIAAWDGQLWVQFIYPASAVTVGSILKINEGCKVGNAIFNKMAFKINENEKWDYYFDEPVNAKYSSIFNDDFNNTEHDHDNAPGYNRILITYNGTAHGNPSTVADKNGLKKYDGYIFINDQPISAFYGGITQVYGWKDAPWVLLIYPASAVSPGSTLLIKEGCKVGNAVLGRVAFELNANNKWENTYAEFAVSFDANGGTGTMNPTVAEKSKYTLPACNFIAPDYKEFDGWKVNGSGDSFIAGSFVNLTNDTTLVAQWALKKMQPIYTGIAPGWNNAHYGGLLGYNQLILSFGEHGVDYLARDHVANATNRATIAYEIGQKLTINGLPIYKIFNKYPNTHVGYDHGFQYFYVQYPIEALLPTDEYLVPTLHIEGGTVFMDSRLPEVTLKLVGGVWLEQDEDDFKIIDPLNLDLYLYSDSESGVSITLPHHIGNVSHAILEQLPAEGSKLAFSVNTGNIDLTDSSNVLMIDNLYKCLLVVSFATGTIVLRDNTQDNAEVQSFVGYQFSTNTNYTFEFDISCGETTAFKFALNHYVVINHTFADDRTGSPDVWAADTSNQLTLDYYHEVKKYHPTIDYTGQIYCDFIEGNPVYNFTGVANAFDLYNDSIDYTYLQYQYQDGAVTDGKYNEGIWTLTISLIVPGYETVTKNITINVHGKHSVAKIYFGDSEPIEVPLFSKLTPPAENPAGYSEGEYDYYFDGWYFEGGKWDFENDIVQGDMHLYPHYKPTGRRYNINVSFVGLNIPSTTYYLAKGNSLPFDLFELEGTTFEVLLNDEVITSLEVQGDTDIVVRYTVNFTYVEPVDPTCTEDGNLGYWYSSYIYPGYYFADSKGREIIPDPVLSMLGHDIIHLDAKEASCHELGNVDCYYCQNCHKHFTDINGEHELIDWFIPMEPHELIHHDAKAATCEEDGNLEYWTCANEPGVYYGDEECSFKLETVVITASGHNYSNPTYTWKEVDGGYECTASMVCSHCHEEVKETKLATKVVVREATCSSEGQIAYSVRFDDPRFNSQNKIVSIPIKEHTYVHVDEVTASEDRIGVKEHYECSECHEYFIKDGDNYVEVQYSDLLYQYQKPKNGCGGSVAAPSFIALASAGALFVLLMLRRKENN